MMSEENSEDVRREIRKMSEQNSKIPEETKMSEEKRFHGWRLLGVIIGVAVVLAIISFVIDWMAIGPLEGRVF